MKMYIRLAAITAVLLAGLVIAYDCPLGECEECLPKAIREGPGVGFELTDNYGTAAVQHYNGTIDHIALIAGTPDYLALLKRLSLSNSTPRQPFLERWHRRLNKHLGRPSTTDVGTLSTMLSSLRQATEQHLGTPLPRVVVTAPSFPALTQEDLADAISHAGLSSWLELPFPFPSKLYSVNAAYAGNGHGLCKEWKDVYACWEEAELGEIPLETVLGVVFTNTTLQVSVSRIRYAFSETYDIMDKGRREAVPALGFDSMAKFGSSEEYWDEVVVQLRGFLGKNNRKRVSEVLLMGERAGEADFARALKDALGDVYTELATVADPTWAAARGAAMYGRVRQEVPWNCSEPPECEKEGMARTREIKDEL